MVRRNYRVVQDFLFRGFVESLSSSKTQGTGVFVRGYV